MPLRFGDFVLDLGARQLMRGEDPRHLGPKAFDLLELLLSHRPNVVAKERIRDHLWPDTIVSYSTVATVVTDLRSALDEDPRQPRFLRTVHGVGYAFCGEATEWKAPGASPETALDGSTPRDATLAVPPRVSVKSLLAFELRGRDEVIAGLGDARATEILGRCEGLIRTAVQRHGGIELERNVVLFERPVDAVKCALEAQQAVSRLAKDERRRLSLPAGVHLGEVTLGEARGESIALVTAQRLGGLAEGNQTLLTRAAFDLARRAAKGDDALPEGVNWLAHGPYGMDGMAEVFDVFEVGVAGCNPLVPPAGDANLSRVIAAGNEETLGWRPATGIEIPGRERWELVEKLGDGGFGEVWLARHQKTREQRVFKFCFVPERLRGLKREVTLFRLLKETLGERDDIAKVLDWSFDKAPYFLEAEYTEGGSLSDWAEAQGGIDQVPLSTRLELVAQVSEALAAAHSVGVLHKDVKPANVLVSERDGMTRAQLTDFGIGLVQDRSVLADRGFTITGFTELAPSSGQSGTRLYMAPELLEGKPSTTLADVYALGVVLYQVVVADLERALAPGWERDVEDDLLREDIAACVEGRPERRLGNALRLAERLRGLPARGAERNKERQIAADAEAAKVGLASAHRRRRIAVMAASVATLFLVVVSLLAARAERARREAERDRQRAIDARAQADGLLAFMLGDLKEKLQPLGRVDLLGPVVEKAVEYYKGIPADEASDETELGRARALIEASDARFKRGEAATKVLEVQKQALEILERLHARRPENREWQAELATAYGWVSTGLWGRGGWEEGVIYASRGIQVAERLVAADTNRGDWQLLCARLYLTRSKVYNALGKFTLSARDRLRAFDIAKRVLARHLDTLDVRPNLLEIWQYTSWALLAVGDRDRVLREGPAMVGLARKLAQEQPRARSWVAGALEGVAPYPAGLAGALLEDGDSSGALAAYEEAETGRRADAARDPDNVAKRLELAQSLTLQADVLRRQGQLVRARRLVDEAARLCSSGAPEPTYEAAIVWSGMLVREGRIRAAQGDREGALAAWTKARDVLRPYESATRGKGGAFLLVPLLLLDEREEARAVLEELLAGGFRYKEMLDLARERGLLPPGFDAPSPPAPTTHP